MFQTGLQHISHQYALPMWPCHFLIQKQNNSPPLESGPAYDMLTDSTQIEVALCDYWDWVTNMQLVSSSLEHSHLEPCTTMGNTLLLWGSYATRKPSHMERPCTRVPVVSWSLQVILAQMPDVGEPVFRCFQALASSYPQPLSLCSPRSRLVGQTSHLLCPVWIPDPQNPWAYKMVVSCP